MSPLTNFATFIKQENRETYKKFSHENITKTYKKTHKKKVRTINVDPKEIAKDLELADKIEKMQENERYITVKGQKEDFSLKMSYWLTNPSKSDIENISKMILGKINNDVLFTMQINQWKNPKAVTE